MNERIPSTHGTLGTHGRQGRDGTPRRDPFQLAAGIGGLLFFVALVIGNAVRFNAVGFFPPVSGASVDDIVQYYAVRGALLGPALAYYAIGVPGLLLFVIGTARRIAAHPTAAVWAWAGAAALLCMPATFGAVAALEAVLANTVVAGAAGGGREMTLVLWSVKEAFFFVNDVVLSIGLTAFAIGSTIAGTSPRWLTLVAIGAGAISLIMVAPLAADVAGALTGWFAFVSFGAWMLFLLNTSIGHLRTGAMPRDVGDAAQPLGEPAVAFQ